jgi:hypothetical protein
MLTAAVQDSFRRLGLSPDVGERDIRRAYARALKKIDQAQDGAGFQQLRGAYETALQFAKAEANGATVADVAVPVPAPEPWPAPPSPDALADAVASDFSATLSALAAKGGGASMAPYEDALRHALTDARLFGLAARQAFEIRVAVILAQGWRPGYQALLGAAATVFDWSRSSGLTGLGAAGAWVDRALEERIFYDGQSVYAKDMQRRVLHLLRQEALPNSAQLLEYMPWLALMMDQFPCWLQIMAPRERIAYWQANACTTPVEEVDDRPAIFPPAPRSPWVMRLAVGLACFLVLALYSSMLGVLRDSTAP